MNSVMKFEKKNSKRKPWVFFQSSFNYLPFQLHVYSSSERVVLSYEKYQKPINQVCLNFKPSLVEILVAINER